MTGSEAYQAWYRKYRSSDFSELVGQSHISRALQNSLKNKNINHAYLFAGTRGVGKTSVARIFARKINNLTHQEAKSHLDIIEIDAASNRRIDEIRQLREKVHVAPTSANYKVYIIDEAHMLTPEAFNALLKTLEEPPEHAVFILATTEIHKLPATIISRTQVFRFSPISKELILAQLKSIAAKEKLVVDAEAFAYIADAANGSMRDAIGILEQISTISTDKSIKLEEVLGFLGFAPNTMLSALTNYISGGRADRALVETAKLLQSGAQPAILVRQLIKYWLNLIKLSLGIGENTAREDIKLAKTIGKNKLMKMVSSMLKLPQDSSYLPLLLEAKLLEIIYTVFDNSAEETVKIEPLTEPKTNQPSPKKTSIKKPVAKSSITQETQNGYMLDDSTWEKIITHIKTKNGSLYTLLRIAKPEFTPNTLMLGFRFQFHKRRMEEARNLDLLSEIIKKFTSKNIPIEVELIEGPSATSNAPSPDSPNKVDSVLKVFGGEIIG